MAKLVKLNSQSSDVWINPLQVRWVLPNGQGAIVEFIDGKKLMVAGNPADVAASISTLLDTSSVWINDKG